MSIGRSYGRLFAPTSLINLFGDHFGTTLGTIWEPFWDHFGTQKSSKKQSRNHTLFSTLFDTILEPILDHFETPFGAISETLAVPRKHQWTSRKSWKTIEKPRFFDGFTVSTVTKKRPKTVSRQSSAKIIVRAPIWHKNGSKSGAKMSQNGSQNGSKNSIETSLVFGLLFGAKKDAKRAFP